jgi:myosin heavy subunit
MTLILWKELTAEENQTLPVRTKTPIQDIDDLIKIDDLNEASVLHNLKKRYSQDKIYVRPPLNSISARITDHDNI